ncbi:fibronectin type III domain-containing protein [Marinobacter fonticola]|uniref:fibronectin type III domain-containing protein n=1 Tax=Marinobacter fonticola TaxID=2603215 RepID=UPI001D0DAA8B|nr:fibronectin type III domain-containing protein [Marinobacter fonticola]
MLNGGAIKGVVSQGQVKAWSLEISPQTGKYEAVATLGQTAVTDSQGRFQLPVAGKTSGWVLIELSADGQTRMTCDVVPSCFVGTPDAVAFGETFILSEDFRLRAAVNLDASREVYLTPLSTLAVALAEESTAGLAGNSIEQAYGEMESAFGLRAGTLQLPPPDLVRLDGFTGSTDAVQLAVINAAFLSLVDGTNWNSIEEVLADSEALIRSEGAFSATTDSDGKPSVDKVMLRSVMLSEDLQGRVVDSSVRQSLETVKTLTENFYTQIVSSNTGDRGDRGDQAEVADTYARLSWDAPFTRMNGDKLYLGELSGYEIRYGRDADEMDNAVTIDDANATSYTIENLAEGEWYFAVRAIDTEGLASALSSVVSKSI